MKTGLVLSEGGDVRGIAHIGAIKALVYPTPPSKSTSEGIAEPFRSVPDMVQLDEVEVKARKRTFTRKKYLGKLDSIAKLETSDYVCKNLPIKVACKRARISKSSFYRVEKAL